MTGPTPHPTAGVTEQHGPRSTHDGRGAIEHIDSGIIVRFFYNDLDEQEAERVKAHLETCEQCSSSLTALAIASEIMKAEQPPPPQA